MSCKGVVVDGKGGGKGEDVNGVEGWGGEKDKGSNVKRHFSRTKQAIKPSERTQEKVTPLLIPYGRFSKVIIYYLARNNNIHRRPDSAVHHTGDDYVLGNLKFVPKGESVEVFGMAIPDPLITEAIRTILVLFPCILKMVAENYKKKPRESASCATSNNACYSQKADNHSPPMLSLETPQEKGEGEGDDADLERAIKLSLDRPFCHKVGHLLEE
ncbi:hypothetical protein Tco_0412156 [Tanacetum coccineum]